MGELFPKKIRWHVKHRSRQRAGRLSLPCSTASAVLRPPFCVKLFCVKLFCVTLFCVKLFCVTLFCVKLLCLQRYVPGPPPQRHGFCPRSPLRPTALRLFADGKWTWCGEVVGKAPRYRSVTRQGDRRQSRPDHRHRHRSTLQHSIVKLTFRHSLRGHERRLHRAQLQSTEHVGGLVRGRVLASK